MKTLRYILNPDCKTISVNNVAVLSSSDILKAILWANEALISIDSATKQFDINVFDTLGMRNLSGMVGEVFVKSVQRFSGNTLSMNLHQDGYPDLLLTDTKEKRNYYQSLFQEIEGKKYPKNKENFSPFKYGGIEIKATCGSTPPANKTVKPAIGDQRIHVVTGFDWKAHHRDTNNLLSVLWDFINGVPTVVAAFYRNDLRVADWSNIVKPKDGGGRTTSVSIMTRTGVSKMCKGWIAVMDDSLYIEKLSAPKWIGQDISIYRSQS